MADYTNTSFTISIPQQELIFARMNDHCQALKNWIASAVEQKEWERATKLTAELRQHQALFAMFNVEAKRIIEGSKP